KPLRRLYNCLIVFTIVGGVKHLKRATQADQEILEEGVRDDPAPIQVPQAPPAAHAPRTMPQWMARLEEEVHELS
nr:hypothetical protein [Tanacetum cinerariifolium]